MTIVWRMGSARTKTDPDPAASGMGAEPRTPAPEEPTAAASSDASAASDDAGASSSSSGSAADDPAVVDGGAPSDPQAELAGARALADKARDQLIRVAADYENFRKRTARDLEDARRRARQATVRELLPVFDNLERATGASQGTDSKAFAEGLQLVLRQFLDTLQKMGVERIDQTGAAFDPMVHESLQMVESADAPAGSVLQVIQAGYRMGAELLRPALVVVSKGPAEGSRPAPEPSEGTDA